MSARTMTAAEIAALTAAEAAKIQRELRDELAWEYSDLAREGRQLAHEARRAGAYSDPARNASLSQRLAESERQHEERATEYSRGAALKHLVAVRAGAYDDAIRRGDEWSGGVDPADLALVIKARRAELT